MNLEKWIWNEDPTKAWMKEYQCDVFRSFMKDTAIPIIERNTARLGSYFSFEKRINRNHQRGFSCLYIWLLFGDREIFKWDVRLCFVEREKFTLPLYLSEYNIVDREVETLGLNDWFFNVKVQMANGNEANVYFTPYHLEEACCILSAYESKLMIGTTEWVRYIVQVNDDGWKRLGPMNPFSMIYV